MLIKYSQNYNLFVFVINSTEVRTETLTIFCVMIPLLVDTWPDFGLFRVVRPQPALIRSRRTVDCSTSSGYLDRRTVATSLSSVRQCKYCYL